MLFNIAFFTYFALQGDVYFDIAVEGQTNPNFISSSMEITRPLRQVLYGLLFSYSDQIQQNHRRKRNQNPILVREWHPCRLKPDRVQALTFPNWKAPSLRQLWLGSKPEDYNRRVRAFLTVFMSDTPLLTEIRPQLVVPCLVLRYLIQQKQSFLTVKHINVFLAVALSNHRNNMGKSHIIFRTFHRLFSLYKQAGSANKPVGY